MLRAEDTNPAKASSGAEDTEHSVAANSAAALIQRSRWPLNRNHTSPSAEAQNTPNRIGWSKVELARARPSRPASLPITALGRPVDPDVSFRIAAPRYDGGGDGSRGSTESS